MAEAPSVYSPLPRGLMLGIAFGQGIALFLLWRALDNQVWPSQTPAVNFPLWTLALAWPILMLLSLERGNLRRCLKGVSLFCAVLALLAIHVGWQATPHGEFPIESLLFVSVVTGAIACFKGLMYCQRWIGQTPLSYEHLFRFSWRNFLVFALASLLTVGVNLILFLTGALFSQIGIDFFRELFREDWFLFPVLAVAFGLGVLIFRRLVPVIDTITALLEGLMRLLLPLIAAVVVVFLGALPFTGLTPLWDTGSGTALLLWLNAFGLFFVNAVYQTGRNLPYPVLFHRLLSPAIALLPIVSVLALYGLYLRIDEYGLTVARCWALTVFLILALFSSGYTWLIVWKRTGWPLHLGRVNTAMGWVVLAVMLLVNSPLLDFRSISLASQLARVEAGETELREFDFYFAKHELARPGYLEMQALIARFEDSDPELVKRIREPERRMPGWEKRHDDLWGRMAYRPERFEAPKGLSEAIWRSRPGLPESHEDFVLIRIDLDTDGVPEYVLLALAKERRHGTVEAWRYSRDGDAWAGKRLFLSGEVPEDIDLAETLRNAEIETVVPRFQNLKVGELEFRGRS